MSTGGAEPRATYPGSKQQSGGKRHTSIHAQTDARTAQDFSENAPALYRGRRVTVIKTAVKNAREVKVADPTGLRALAEGLKVNAGLAELYLTQVGVEGAMLLASALKQNGSLRVLSLTSDEQSQTGPVRSEGGLALAAALEANTTLELLDLRHDQRLGPANEALAKRVNAAEAAGRRLEVKGLRAVS